MMDGSNRYRDTGVIGVRTAIAIACRVPFFAAMRDWVLQI
jgi:hypothetical protein